MKKLIISLFVIAAFQFSAVAQSETDKLAASNQELKTSLAAKLKIVDDKADKIIAIEDEFHNSIAAAGKLPENTTAEKKEKQKNIHSAHVLRRQKLMELPLTGREMEDVIEISEAARRKHKL